MTYEHKFIEVSGVRLHYLDWPSEGPPLLIVHGNSHSGGVFAPLGDRLAASDASGGQGFHVMSLDLRGHGLSERPGVYTWTSFLEELTGFIDQLDLSDLLLVAHSRGGGLSLLAASARRERMKGLVVFEPTMPATPSLRGRLDELVQRTLNRRARFASRQEMFEHFRGRGAFKDWQDEFLQAYVDHGAVENESGGVELANPVEVEAVMYETMLQDEEWANVHECPVPVLAVYGERNARLREGWDPVATLRGYFPNTTMSIQPDSTHSGIMEQPDVFAASVRQFASGLKGFARRPPRP